MPGRKCFILNAMDKIKAEIDLEDVLNLIGHYDKIVSMYQFVKNPTEAQLDAQSYNNEKVGYWKRILNDNWPK